MQTAYQEQDQDLLTSFEPNIVPASAGKRLANYLIDLASFYLIVFLVAVVLAFISPSLFENYIDSPGISLIERVLSLLLYGLYMFGVEAVFKGKSLGKLITGTRAVNLDGSRITIKTALGRGFSRAVPFNELSALGSPANPWHDRWNKTMVMDEKRSDIEGDF